MFSNVFGPIYVPVECLSFAYFFDLGPSDSPNIVTRMEWSPRLVPCIALNLPYSLQQVGGRFHEVAYTSGAVHGEI